MILIIAEKEIAGRRIAQLLSDDKFHTEKHRTKPYFVFTKESKEYVVVPLKGHIKDVDFPSRYSAWIGTDLKSLINAEILYGQKEEDIISLLKYICPTMDSLVIATDADREGESIGLEAITVIQEKNKSLNIKRALFSAITKQDLDEAFSSLSNVDYALADSADARREIDLIWGAVLTRYLSIVSNRLGSEFISAGRVQSPTLALIVDREKERLAFKTQMYWEIFAEFDKNGERFIAAHKNGRFWEKDKAEAVMQKRADFGTVTDVKKSKKLLKRPEPFNTTSFLAAATVLGFSASKAMSIAEDLYQRGFISYPRTDNAEYPATLNIRKLLETLSHYGPLHKDISKLLSQDTLIPSKGKSSKDHPPIHPVSVPTEELSLQHLKIYELVTRRFLATLAKDAIVEVVRIDIDMNTEPFVATGQTFIELGWKEFYPYSAANEVILPNLAQGDNLKLIDLKLSESETKPPARYSQGSLIKEMAARNLGTKSTRHEIIQKLYYRNYISGQKSIIPNKIAFAVVDSLEKYDGMVLKSEMTAELEKEMDLIAAAKKSKPEVVTDSRKMLEIILDELLKNKDKIGQSLKQALLEDRKLVKCLDRNCTGMLLIRKGYSGKRFLGCTSYPRCRVTLPLPQQGDIVTLEEKCAVCEFPMIKILNGRRSFKMCLNPNCASKEEWRNRAKAKNSEIKKSPEPKKTAKKEAKAITKVDTKQIK